MVAVYKQKANEKQARSRRDIAVRRSSAGKLLDAVEVDKTVSLKGTKL